MKTTERWVMAHKFGDADQNVDVTDLVQARIKDNKLELPPSDPIWLEMEARWQATFGPCEVCGLDRKAACDAPACQYRPRSWFRQKWDLLWRRR